MDKELINSKVDIIEQNMELLEELRDEDFNEFRDNRRDIQAAKYSLQESIVACIDIAYHIVSSENYGRPDDYRDAFKILENNKFLEKDLSERLQDMASFRNLLVHKYGEIDVERLYKILEEDIEDVKKFLREVVEKIETRTSQ